MDTLGRLIAQIQEWVSGWSGLHRLIVAQGVLYLLLAILAERFDFHSPFPQRPILGVVALLIIASGLQLASLWSALRIPDQAGLYTTILVPAVVFRVFLLPTLPIQEVDIYRYLWDGTVTSAGVSPYQFSPQQVLDATDSPEADPRLRHLVQVRDRSPAMQEVLRRVHFGELTTLYPPVSQAVFALAGFVSSPTTSVREKLTLLKGILVLFDLATLGLVMAILKVAKRHMAWSITYAWSPLVLKEFANSGHLDSIAVFLTTAAVYVWVRLRQAEPNRMRAAPVACVGFLLGLAVGAKLYPVVLLPYMVGRFACESRWKAAGVLIVTCGLMSVVCLSSMFEDRPTESEVTVPSNPLFESSSSAPPPPTGSGLTVFLSRWEINDLPFMVIVENLRPDRIALPNQTAPARPWFVLLPNAWRSAGASVLSQMSHRPIGDATFLTARLITLAIYGLLWIALISRHSRFDGIESDLRGVFLTLAWFWALSPTMNPWYWTWALPFVPFAGRRAWQAVSGVVLLYYLRFWCLYHLSTTTVAGCRGEEVFHYLIVPLEHGVWLAWLAWEIRKKPSVCRASQTTDDPQPTV